jgi:hypothetical protein
MRLKRLLPFGLLLSIVPGCVEVERAWACRTLAREISSQLGASRRLERPEDFAQAEEQVRQLVEKLGGHKELHPAAQAAKDAFRAELKTLANELRRAQAPRQQAGKRPPLARDPKRWESLFTKLQERAEKLTVACHGDV